MIGCPLRPSLACTRRRFSRGQVYRHSAAIDKIDPAILLIIKASDFWQRSQAVISPSFTVAAVRVNHCATPPRPVADLGYILQSAWAWRETPRRADYVSTKFP